MVTSGELQQVSGEVDEDNSGEIDFEELKKLMESIYGEGSDIVGDVQKTMLDFDEDGDGLISWTEFKAVMDHRQDGRRLGMAERIFATFDDPSCSRTARYISMFIMGLIFVSSTVFIMDSMPAFRKQKWCLKLTDASHKHYTADGGCHADAEPGPDPVFASIEAVCIICFSLEYIIRLCTAHAVRTTETSGGATVDILGNELEEEEGGSAELTGCGRTSKFFWNTMNLIDFVAIIPWYLEKMVSNGPGGLNVLRVLRLVRIFRIFKLGKYNEGMQMFARVVMNSFQAFYLLIFFFVLGIILFGAMIFFAEGGTWFGVGDMCPDLGGKCTEVKPYCINCTDIMSEGTYLRMDVTGLGWEPTPFKSITTSFWWVVTTTTTVGYGDLYPTSVAGKIVGTVTILCGILVLALPISIIGQNFTKEFQDDENAKEEEELAREEAAMAKAAEGLTGVQAALARAKVQAEFDKKHHRKKNPAPAPAPAAPAPAAEPTGFGLGSAKVVPGNFDDTPGPSPGGGDGAVGGTQRGAVPPARDRLVKALEATGDSSVGFVMSQAKALANVATTGRISGEQQHTDASPAPASSIRARRAFTERAVLFERPSHLPLNARIDCPSSSVFSIAQGVTWTRSS